MNVRWLGPFCTASARKCGELMMCKWLCCSSFLHTRRSGESKAIRMPGTVKRLDKSPRELIINRPNAFLRVFASLHLRRNASFGRAVASFLSLAWFSSPHRGLVGFTHPRGPPLTCLLIFKGKHVINKDRKDDGEERERIIVDRICNLNSGQAVGFGWVVKTTRRWPKATSIRSISYHSQKVYKFAIGSPQFCVFVLYAIKLLRLFVYQYFISSYNLNFFPRKVCFLKGFIFFILCWYPP